MSSNFENAFVNAILIEIFKRKVLDYLKEHTGWAYNNNLRWKLRFATGQILFGLPYFYVIVSSDSENVEFQVSVKINSDVPSDFFCVHFAKYWVKTTNKNTYYEF